VIVLVTITQIVLLGNVQIQYQLIAVFGGAHANVVKGDARKVLTVHNFIIAGVFKQICISSFLSTNKFHNRSLFVDRHKK